MLTSSCLTVLSYANAGMLEAAIEEFEKAIQIDKEDKNAIKYLELTRLKVITSCWIIMSIFLKYQTTRIS